MNGVDVWKNNIFGEVIVHQNMKRIKDSVIK